MLRHFVVGQTRVFAYECDYCHEVIDPAVVAYVAFRADAGFWRSTWTLHADCIPAWRAVYASVADPVKWQFEALSDVVRSLAPYASEMGRL